MKRLAAVLFAASALLGSVAFAAAPASATVACGKC